MNLEPGIFHHAFAKRVSLEQIPLGTLTKKWLHIIPDVIGNSIAIPILIAKGYRKGPVLGLIAALHGNELNGIPIIHSLFKQIDLKALKGTIVAIPVFNIPGFMQGQREFIDGIDLNAIMPGSSRGSMSKVYVHTILKKIVSQFTYLIDFHTARFGSCNSYYVRANLENPLIKDLAYLQNPDLILHNVPKRSNLRGTAEELGILGITVELGDPLKYQQTIIDQSLQGVFNVLYYLKMLSGTIISQKKTPLICERSYRVRVKKGGVAEVNRPLLSKLKKGDVLGQVKNVFGEELYDIIIPTTGVLIGKSINPIRDVGSSIAHIGVIAKK